MTDHPSLFGLKNSNRDFSRLDSWGKNQFNSSFPAALCCYMEANGFAANYCHINNGAFSISLRTIEEMYSISSLSPDIFFAFEAAYAPYQRFVIGSIPRTDMVIQNKSTGQSVRALEVKLTALPDNTTCGLTEDKYGTEIVVRPDTIAYLACSIIESMGSSLEEIIKAHYVDVHDWSEPAEVLEKIRHINDAIGTIVSGLERVQIPFLLQPIWKTNGKSPVLSENCLDVFFWSNAAFCRFLSDNCVFDRITRQTRTVIWLYKMLYDYCRNRAFNYAEIIDELSYNTKNDKAFASSGMVTNRYMASPNLARPRVTKHEIKNIVLGGGQNLLSPERRFDAIICNSPDLFEEQTEL